MNDKLIPSQMTSRQVRENCPLDDECKQLMHQAVVDLGLTADDHDDILRAAKTIANNTEDATIKKSHLVTAINDHRGGNRSSTMPSE